jgi:hypothetical protein
MFNKVGYRLIFDIACFFSSPGEQIDVDTLGFFYNPVPRSFATLEIIEMFPLVAKNHEDILSVKQFWRRQVRVFNYSSP